MKDPMLTAAELENEYEREKQKEIEQAMEEDDDE